jgi:hypothetical protein
MTVETLPCARCGKPPGVCICDRVEPVATKLKVVILQHPQEDDAILGTAGCRGTPPRAEIHVGLSWASLDTPGGRNGPGAVGVLAVARPGAGKTRNDPWS